MILLHSQNIVFVYFNSFQLEDLKSQNQHLEYEFKEITARFNREKKELEKLQQHAVTIAPISDEDGNPLPLREKLNDLPETITEIEESMEDKHEKINSIHDNPEVMRRYEQQKRELEEVNERLQDMKDSKQQKRENLQAMKDPWEASLTKLVGKASVLFSGYMRELGCAGEIIFFLSPFKIVHLLLSPAS